jgi:uncharacterized protein YfbU (UPF0304 family)
MDMHLDLINSYFALDQKDRDKICFEDVQFQGFDHVGAGNHHRYADFLVNVASRFSQLFRDEKGDQIDPKTTFNHGPGIVYRLDVYREMLDKYTKLTKASAWRHGELSSQDIKEILPNDC